MRLLLIEDDPVIARELQLRWSSRGWDIEHCATLQAATQATAGAMPDLVVLDLGLPDGEGLDWLAALRRRDRQTPVLVLTARDRVADRVLGLQSGADDYLIKPFAAEELDARVQVLSRRSLMQRGEQVAFGRLMWLGSEGRAFLDGEALELSPREYEVLGMLIRRAPRLVPKRVLSDALAERNLEVGEAAVEVYVSRLRRKLAGSGVEIKTMRGFGYLLSADATAA